MRQQESHFRFVFEHLFIQVASWLSQEEIIQDSSS